MGVENYTWWITGPGIGLVDHESILRYLFEKEGTYSLNLTIRDSAGNTDRFEFTVMVRDPKGDSKTKEKYSTLCMVGFAATFLIFGLVILAPFIIMRRRRTDSDDEDVELEDHHVGRYSGIGDDEYVPSSYAEIFASEVRYECAVCGTLIDDDDEVCPGCGTEFGTAESEDEKELVDVEEVVEMDDIGDMDDMGDVGEVGDIGEVEELGETGPEGDDDDVSDGEMVVITEDVSELREALETEIIEITELIYRVKKRGVPLDDEVDALSVIMELKDKGKLEDAISSINGIRNSLEIKLGEQSRKEKMRDIRQAENELEEIEMEVGEHFTELHYYLFSAQESVKLDELGDADKYLKKFYRKKEKELEALEKEVGEHFTDLHYFLFSAKGSVLDEEFDEVEEMLGKFYDEKSRVKREMSKEKKTMRGKNGTMLLGPGNL